MMMTHQYPNRIHGVSPCCWENRIFVSFAEQKFRPFAPKESNDPFEHMICSGYLCLVSTVKGKVYCIDDRKKENTFVELESCEEFKQDRSRIKVCFLGGEFLDTKVD